MLLLWLPGLMLQTQQAAEMPLTAVHFVAAAVPGARAQHAATQTSLHQTASAHQQLLGMSLQGWQLRLQHWLPLPSLQPQGPLAVLLQQCSQQCHKPRDSQQLVRVLSCISNMPHLALLTARLQQL